VGPRQAACFDILLAQINLFFSFKKMTWPTKPAWTPHFTTLPKASRVDSCFWGKKALLRVNETWPECACGKSLILVAQLNREKLPEPFMASKQMWQIFACTTCEMNVPLVRAVAPVPVNSWVEKEGPDNNEVLRIDKWNKCLMQDHAHPEEAELLLGEKICKEEWLNKAHVLFKGPKLGGHAVWLSPMQTCACRSCGVEMIHCMTLEADNVRWGGSSHSNLALFCCLEHPNELEVLVLIP
jgi:hypothetical protein